MRRLAIHTSIVSGASVAAVPVARERIKSTTGHCGSPGAPNRSSRTGIATASISGSLSEKLEAIAAEGFGGIEIFEQDFLADAGAPREIGQRIRDYGLEILLFQPFRDFEGLPTALSRKAFVRADRKFDLMQELGTDLVLVYPSVSAHGLGGIDRAADDFAALGEQAAAHGLRVCYEALAWGRYVNDHREAWEVVRRASHPKVGLVLDSFHALARRIDPETLRRIPGERISCVQLAGVPEIEMDLLYLSRHDELINRFSGTRPPTTRLLG